MKKKNFLLILSFGLLLALVWGCGDLEKGNFPTNVPPQVYLVNIPLEGASFSINPRVYWWGTDPDGRIVEYQYLVLPDSKMDAEGNIIDLGLIKKDANGLIDSLFVKAIEKIPYTEWVDTLIAKYLNEVHHAHRDSLIAVVDTQTSVNVMMFAEMDTTIYINQYFFVRGVDDKGAVSRIWKPLAKGGHVFRRLSRNNHPPDTHIDTVNFAKSGVHYCLPETTQTWKGLKIRWEGSDSSDYPAKQPDFYYKWELFGPFQDTNSVDLSVIVDSSWDSTGNTRWVLNTSRTLVNLKNYDEENGGKDGWYLFRVASRDDAFVEDRSPDQLFIHVVHPLIDFWPENQRKVLLVDVSVYGSIRSYGFPQKEEGRQKILNVYKDMVSSIAGEVGISFDFWYDSTVIAEAVHSPPNELLLSNYKLVVVLNHSNPSGLEGGRLGSDSGYVQYKNYLDVGGSVWFVGVNNWSMVDRGWHNTSYTDRRGNFAGRVLVSDLVRDYFGLLQFYYPLWAISGTGRNDEFIGARPFLGVIDYPYLESDKAKVDTLLGWRRNQDPIVLPMANAVPGVNAMVISSWSERLYDFVSINGTNSELNGKPCAIRSTGPVYKTAEFCFPLYLVKQEQAKEIMKIMINWFLEPIVL
jgi:hypothetical protein